MSLLLLLTINIVGKNGVGEPRKFKERTTCYKCLVLVYMWLIICIQECVHMCIVISVMALPPHW